MRIDIFPSPFFWNQLSTSIDDLSRHFMVYTILIQGISTIFTDQMPVYLVFKKYIPFCIKIFDILPYSLTILKNEKAKFKLTLKNT
jgi:hypothetical protein